jgi:hypothetical protein
MRELSEEKKWPRGYVVVTEVTHAARTTVLSSLGLLTAAGGPS